LIEWYKEQFSDYAFVLACFNGEVRPRHPIVVEYFPHSDDVLFVPGLDGHTGDLPAIGQPMQRDFRVAFASEAHTLPLNVHYSEQIFHERWAPLTVTGFYDNRPHGENTDYVLPLESIEEGFFGHELLDTLIS